MISKLISVNWLWNSKQSESLFNSNSKVEALYSAAKKQLENRALRDTSFSDLLLSGIDINSIDENGNNALVLAILKNDFKVARFLIRSGINSNALNHESKSPLHFAAVNGDSDILKLLVNYKDSLMPQEREINTFQINILDSAHRSPLHFALLHQNIAAAKLLIEFGSEFNTEDAYLIAQHIEKLNEADEEGNTLLHQFCIKNQSKWIQALVDAGANLRAQNKNRLTPYELAYMHGKNNTDIFRKKLLCINAKYYYWSFLSWAQAEDLYVAAKNKKLSEFINNRWAYIDTKSKTGPFNTSLQMAAAEGHIQAMTELLHAGANIQLTNELGNTALHLACEKGSVEAVFLLLSLGANLHLKNKENKSPMDIIREKGHLHILAKLHVLDNSLNELDERGNTPLYLAAEKNAVEATKTLSIGGANLDIANTNNWTALHIACYNNNLEVAKILIKTHMSQGKSAIFFVTSLITALEKNYLDLALFILAKMKEITEKTKILQRLLSIEDTINLLICPITQKFIPYGCVAEITSDENIIYYDKQALLKWKKDNDFSFYSLALQKEIECFRHPCSESIITVNEIETNSHAHDDLYNYIKETFS